MEKTDPGTNSPEGLDLRRLSAFFAALVGLMFIGLAWPRGDFVLVIGTPGSNENSMMRLIGEAGGTFVSAGGMPWLAVAHAEKPGFARRLLTSGAMLVVDHALAAGCLERTTNERS